MNINLILRNQIQTRRYIHTKDSFDQFIDNTKIMSS